MTTPTLNTNDRVLDQRISLLEATELCYGIFLIIQDYDGSITRQEDKHNVLAAIAQAYHRSLKEKQPDGQPTGVTLRGIMRNLINNRLDDRTMEQFVRDTYDVPQAYSLSHLGNLGLFGSLLGTYYNSLTGYDGYTGEWLYDLHNHEIVVPRHVRKWILENRSQTWRLVGSDLQSSELMSGNAMVNDIGIVYSIGVGC